MFHLGRYLKSSKPLIYHGMLIYSAYVVPKVWEKLNYGGLDHPRSLSVATKNDVFLCVL